MATRTELTYEESPGSEVPGCTRFYDEANTDGVFRLTTNNGHLLPIKVEAGYYVQICSKGQPKTRVLLAQHGVEVPE